VWGEFGESVEGILAQGSRFGRDVCFALMLDVDDATIDRVNQFPKVPFYRGLCERGIREVDHQGSWVTLARRARCECLKVHSHPSHLFTLEQTRGLTCWTMDHGNSSRSTRTG
jgi:hypothetical protein